jgi:hypothetical protein
MISLIELLTPNQFASHPILCITLSSSSLQNTAANIVYSSATRQAWFIVMVPSPQRLSAVFIKASGVTRFTATTVDGEEILIDSAMTEFYTGGRKYDLPPDRIIQSFRLESDSAGVNDGYCYGGEVRIRLSLPLMLS